MSDPFSAGSSLAFAPGEYYDKVKANEAARKLNATNDKWAPLLALNHSKGNTNIPVPKASALSVFGPAITSASHSMSPFQGMSGGGGGGGGGSEALSFDENGMVDTGGLGVSGGASGAASGASFAGIYNKGGTVPQAGYSNGGGIGQLASLLPMLLMLAAHGGQVPDGPGGQVPGKEVVPGDSPLNDTKMIGVSPGEVILPKSVAREGMKGNKWKVASYLNDVKKHGPGPLPMKGGGASAPGVNLNLLLQ
jgi:hypothetical protein